MLRLLMSRPARSRALGRIATDPLLQFQWPDRRIFLILDDRSVVKRADQRSTGPELRQQALVIDIEAKRLGCRVQVGAIDKERNPFGR